MRRKQTASVTDRLTLFAKEIREKALRLAPGPERDALLRKIKQADTAAELEKRWANFPELQPPK